MKFEKALFLLSALLYLAGIVYAIVTRQTGRILSDWPVYATALSGIMFMAIGISRAEEA